MKRPRWWLVAPALLASAVLSVASAAEVRDKAGLFTADTIKKAQVDLDKLEKEYSVPVTVETIESLDGATLSQEVERRAAAVKAEGIYVLIPKKEHKILAEASKHYRQYLPRSRMEAVQDAFLDQFKKGDFDGGLTQGVTKLGSVLGDAKAASGGSIRQNTAPNTRRAGAAAPVRPNPAGRNSSGGFSLIWLIVGGLALFFLFRIIGSVFGAMRGNQYGGGGMMGGRGGYPGPGGPGYGGGGYGGAPAGGGGFMSSLFGGIGGAMAGNWLYDRMSGGHQQGGGYTDQTGYDAGAGATPVDDAGSEWANNDAGADWGGGGVADNSGAAGGDWGGGGGGDWGGGGGGGGDWGGGGGGDDNGGSW